MGKSKKKPLKREPEPEEPEQVDTGIEGELSLDVRGEKFTLTFKLWRDADA